VCWWAGMQGRQSDDSVHPSTGPPGTAQHHSRQQRVQFAHSSEACPVVQPQVLTEQAPHILPSSHGRIWCLCLAATKLQAGMQPCGCPQHAPRVGACRAHTSFLLVLWHPCVSPSELQPECRMRACLASGSYCVQLLGGWLCGCVRAAITAANLRRSLLPVGHVGCSKWLLGTTECRFGVQPASCGAVCIAAQLVVLVVRPCNCECRQFCPVGAGCLCVLGTCLSCLTNTSRHTAMVNPEGPVQLALYCQLAERLVLSIPSQLAAGWRWNAHCGGSRCSSCQSRGQALPCQGVTGVPVARHLHSSPWYLPRGLACAAMGAGPLRTSQRLSGTGLGVSTARWRPCHVCAVRYGCAWLLRRHGWGGAYVPACWLATTHSCSWHAAMYQL
jgi:hypothetical protein